MSKKLCSNGSGRPALGANRFCCLGCTMSYYGVERAPRVRLFDGREQKCNPKHRAKR